MLSLASKHGAEVLHGPGEGHMVGVPGLWPGDVSCAPCLDEHLAVVVTIGQREELLPPK